MFCPHCQADLRHHHRLENRDVPPMSNQSRILQPACAGCGYLIRPEDLAASIRADQKVLLITGTAGAGKTALGQCIEKKYGSVFIDGDAIQKRVHHDAKRDPSMKLLPNTCQTETLRTLLTVLGLGYNAVVGYIINREILGQYRDALAPHGIRPVFRVLVPAREVCLQRDLDRPCWTAGAKWVDMWYEEMRSFLDTNPDWCIDSSGETLEETLGHFEALLV